MIHVSICRRLRVHEVEVAERVPTNPFTNQLLDSGLFVNLVGAHYFGGDLPLYFVVKVI